MRQPLQAIAFLSSLIAGVFVATITSVYIVEILAQLDAYLR